MLPLRLAVPLIVTAFLLACGGGAPTDSCLPSNCQGCCDSQGQCQPGHMPQACGGNAGACVACSDGLVCQFGYCTGGGGGCKPKSCAQLGFNCGAALDGCGGELNCGTCEAPGEACGAGGESNVCGGGSCTPKSCGELGATCGQVSDGCGSILNCGTCTAPETCGGSGTPNQCGLPSCTAKTCAELGKNCGTVSDGCGGQLDCGACAVTGETCGGGGTPNVCGKAACAPKTCVELGKSCGAADDGCGNAIDCGGCTAPLTCGGAGEPNVCGASCAKGCPSGFSCTSQGVCQAASPTSLVLNVVQAPKAQVTGRITLNGATPTLTCSASSPASIRFESTVDSHYDTVVEVPCVAAFTFSANLYPSTYKVSVSGTGYSNLPGWYVEVVERIALPAGSP